MTDSISTQHPTPKRRLSRRTVAIIAAAAVVVVGGGVTTAVTATRAYAAETDRLCSVALKAGSAATKAATTSSSDAEKALEASKNTMLAEDKWTTTKYADHAATKPVEAVAATKGEAAIEAVAARPSGKEFTEAVSTAATTLGALKTPTTCEERDEATNITAKVKKVTAASKALQKGTEALNADFALFQKDEHTRIAAEKAAAKKKAEEEAAAEAARRAAAAQAAAAPRQNSSGGSGHSGGSSSRSHGSSHTSGGPASPGASLPSSTGSSGSTGSGSAPRPPSSHGGGGVGSGGHVVRRCDNGVGGTTTDC